MVAFPGCKINLGLHILGRRPDGFHDIDTVFYPVPWSDILEFLPAEKFSFDCTGLKIPGSSSDNLCVRACKLLIENHKMGAVQGHLHKIVPMGSGLGGGSADAASTLGILNAICSLGLDKSKLRDYARVLGSDCSFFVDNKPARGTGRGESLAQFAIDLRGFFLVIVVPPLQISTRAAYTGVTPRVPKEDLMVILSRPLAEWKDRLVNDFEPSLFARHPVIAELKDKLYALGATYASMSGSGSAVFGLFRNPVRREEHFTGIAGWSGWL